MSEDDLSPEEEEESRKEKASTKFPLWVILLIVALVCVVAVPCMAIVAAIAIPNLLASKVATNETAAIQNLKALATAQSQYIKKKDFYSDSGKDLSLTGYLIAPDLAAAFESYLGNGDPAQPAPKAGYLYRMLQGEEGQPTFWHKKPGDHAMNTWAATDRPAIAGTTGSNQFYISEAGTVYQKKDPNTGKFLLDVCPPETQTDWKPAR